MFQITRFLARLIGIFAIVVVAATLARGSAMIQSMVGNDSIMFVLAMIGLAGGLAMVLAHNVWSGGLLPVVVTIVGWLILAKGLLLLFLTSERLAQLLELMHYGKYFYLFVAPAFVIGAYLTWAGFTARPSNARPTA